MKLFAACPNCDEWIDKNAYPILREGEAQLSWVCNVCFLKHHNVRVLSWHDIIALNRRADTPTGVGVCE